MLGCVPVVGLTSSSVQSTTHWSLLIQRHAGTHTQHVESYWGRLKKRFKSMNGVHAEQLPSYLDEFMWRERYGTDPNLAFDYILVNISSQYPV